MNAGITIEPAADVGVSVWINGGPFIHRGGGKWTRPSILEMAEKFPCEKVPGFFTEIVYGIRNDVPEHGRPLSVGAPKAGAR